MNKNDFIYNIGDKDWQVIDHNKKKDKKNSNIEINYTLYKNKKKQNRCNCYFYSFASIFT